MKMLRAEHKKRRRVLPRLLWLSLATGIALLALVYLRLHSHCDTLGRQIQRLEEERDELHRRAVAEEYKWANRNSLREIRLALARFHIEMSWPEERRVIRLARALDAAEIGTAAAPQLVLHPARGEAHIP